MQKNLILQCYKPKFKKQSDKFFAASQLDKAILIEEAFNLIQNINFCSQWNNL